MKNAFTFAKNDNTIQVLANLDAKLNDVTADSSYSVFLMNKIISERLDTVATATAKQLLAKQQELKDELDYLNSCLVFLYQQHNKQTSLSSLTEGEINTQMEELTRSVQQFLSLRHTYQNVCLRFVSKQGQNGGRQLRAA
ncbi:MAG: hypothetical protein AAGJ18_01850 [Bacteroidota bacterium]